MAPKRTRGVSPAAPSRRQRTTPADLGSGISKTRSRVQTEDERTYKFFMDLPENDQRSILKYLTRQKDAAHLSAVLDTEKALQAEAKLELDLDEWNESDSESESGYQPIVYSIDKPRPKLVFAADGKGCVHGVTDHTPKDCPFFVLEVAYGNNFEFPEKGTPEYEFIVQCNRAGVAEWEKILANPKQRGCRCQHPRGMCPLYNREKIEPPQTLPPKTKLAAAQADPRAILIDHGQGCVHGAGQEPELTCEYYLTSCRNGNYFTLPVKGSSGYKEIVSSSDQGKETWEVLSAELARQKSTGKRPRAWRWAESEPQTPPPKVNNDDKLQFPDVDADPRAVCIGYGKGCVHGADQEPESSCKYFLLLTRSGNYFTLPEKDSSGYKEIVSSSDQGKKTWEVLAAQLSEQKAATRRLRARK